MTEEYLALRAEITGRLQILHQQLNVAVVMLLTSLIFGFVLYIVMPDLLSLETFLLFLPIVFGCLTFNYQSNQMTMEAVSFYLRDHSQNKELTGPWEQYWTDQKRNFQLISFLKTLPLFLPLVLPIVLIIWHGAWPTIAIDQILTGVDLALLALVLFNFRFKLKR